jgi:hypothetical protein
MFPVREITVHNVPRVVDVIRAAFEEYRGRLDPLSFVKIPFAFGFKNLGTGM